MIGVFIGVILAVGGGGIAFRPRQNVRLERPAPGFFVSFFFFQAEDGIRDSSVTGVQTCALPISKVNVMGPRTFTFAPGSKQEASFSVLLNNDIDHGPTEPAWDFAFPHPGTYFIKANVLSGLGTLTSNVIQVVIQQPKRDDVPVWEAIRTDKRLARFLQDPRPGQATSGEPQQLQQLLNDHPQSSHALYIKRALDRHSRVTAKLP